ncbi:MAG: GIY-YIG nuclease family protein [Hassallia sp.]
MAWQQRDDSVPGQIYLMKAIGYGGIIPGCLIGRYKIGFSRNPEARLDQLLSAQPCCDIEIIHTVDVEDMAEVEGELHKIFKNSNIKLIKSQEWFDFNPFQVQHCIWLMNRYEIKTTGREPISSRAVVGGLIALLGVGMLVGHNFEKPTQQQIQQQKVR